MDVSRLVPLVEVTRGREAHGEEAVEGIHLGSVVVVTGRGELVAALGDPEHRTHLRSTAKFAQLLPLLLEGIHRAPLGGVHAITASDLAVMMASHSGQPMHVEAVSRLLSAAGLEPEALRCGAHPPVHGPSAEALIRAGEAPGVLHCNCSGKHTGMLLVCQRCGWTLEDYLDPEHPLQRRIKALVSALSGVAPEALGAGVDGCSAPTFVMPLVGLARLYGRLALPEAAPAPEAGVPEALAEAFAAGTAHPEMIGGDDRIDTALMRALPGRILAKVGAMGAHAVAVRPCERWPDGLGVALKVLDGDRANTVRPVLTPEVLVQLGVLRRDHGHAELLKVSDARVTNNRGLVVGQVRPVIDLGVCP